MIVIVFGLPGSGKTYFAFRLAVWLNADYANSDQIRKKMFAARTYSTKEKLLVYNEMLAQMRQAITQSKNLVMDATFYKNDIRAAFINEAQEEAGIIFIEVKAEEAIIKERLQQKRVDSEADYEAYKLIKQQWEPLDDQHLIFNSTNDNIEYLLDKAMDYLHLKR